MDGGPTPHGSHATTEDERGIDRVSLENDIQICVEVVVLVYKTQ